MEMTHTNSTKITHGVTLPQMAHIMRSAAKQTPHTHRSSMGSQGYHSKQIHVMPAEGGGRGREWRKEEGVEGRGGSGGKRREWREEEGVEGERGSEGKGRRGEKGRRGGDGMGGSIKTKQTHKDFGVHKLTSEWPGSLAPNPRAGNCLSLEKQKNSKQITPWYMLR